MSNKRLPIQLVDLSNKQHQEMLELINREIPPSEVELRTLRAKQATEFYDAGAETTPNFFIDPNTEKPVTIDSLKLSGDLVPQRVERMMKWFNWNHLPEELQAVAKPFWDIVFRITDSIPAGEERTVCLRHLLDAKNAAIRAYEEGQGK